MDKTIVIDVQNNVNVQGQASITQTVEGRGINFGAISSQFLVAGGRKLISATGNTELARFLGESGKYGFAVSRIIASGGTDVTAAAGLALDLAGEALKKATETAKAQAKLQNDVDMARLRAGLLDLSATDKITTNWWSGRYTYGRGG